ncbi:CsgG/HfaB family protein [Sanyastnella coralliicola]|uniref:CsgG/HfaB family protein n=1 Tax=Sanyastnella coralliicola TaxID=3069118 RepID=UPI0027B9F940|nr:CsgG/HfaB family protein [Longitalea sp. SCSIO 12813]
MRITLLLLIALSLTACQGYKKSMAEAEQYRTAGMHLEALDRFEAIYKENPKKVEAHIQLKETATFVMNKYYSEVQLLIGQGNYQSALNALDRAEDFMSKYQWLGLETPFYAANLRSEARYKLGQSYFVRAQQAVEAEEWDDAEMYAYQARKYGFREKELDYLEVMIDIVPTFRKGLKAKELGLYQDAYAYFEEVSEIDADFSDVLLHMDECLEKSSFTISYLHAGGHLKANRDKAIITGVKEEILSLDNPFIRVVSRDDLDVILDEQMNSMTGAFDEDIIVEAGKLLGAEFLIVGELLNSESQVSPVSRVRKKGYEGNTVIAKKVEYTEKSQTVKHIVSYRYHLLDAETGEVLAAENIPYTFEENHTWLDYSGDPDQLYPGQWKYKLILSATDAVDLDNAAKQDIMEKARRRPLKVSDLELEQRFIEFISQEVANKVDRLAWERKLTP